MAQRPRSTKRPTSAAVTSYVAISSGDIRYCPNSLVTKMHVRNFTALKTLDHCRYCGVAITASNAPLDERSVEK